MGILRRRCASSEGLGSRPLLSAAPANLTHVGLAIEATGLVKRYKNVVALDGVDLAVPRGTVLGLLGPNGAGKTTTVRVLTTLLKPDAGRATVAGVDVLSAPVLCAAGSGCPGSTRLSTSTSPATGLIVGWRIRSSFWEAAGGYLILLVFAYAVSWVMAWMGLLVPSVEVINQAFFIVLFPITFIANTFVPLKSLPRPLEIFAQWNPVSAITQAARNLFGNDALVAEPTVWPLQHPVVYTMIWTVVILAIFIPLTNLQYRRATSR